MKRFFLTFVVFAALLSGTAQNKTNCRDIAISHYDDFACVPCNEDGFCTVALYKANDSVKVELSVYDTLMEKSYDASFKLLQDFKLKSYSYENSELCMIFLRNASKKLVQWAIVFYDFSDKSLSIRIFDGSYPANADLSSHFDGNFAVSILDNKNRGKLFFLPKNSSEIVNFDFNIPNYQVLDLISSEKSGEFVFCITADNKTFFFEATAEGVTNFANVVDFSASEAKIVEVSNGHYVLVMRDTRDDFIAVKTLNINNKKAFANNEIYYAGVGKVQFADTLNAHKTFEVASRNDIGDFSVFSGDDLIACVAEISHPEYYQYYNGYYYDTRFYGYRYDRAEVIFFDTVGALKGEFFVPYDDSRNLYVNEVKKTKVAFLPNDEILLYYMDNEGLTTQIINKSLSVVDPLRTQEIPLRSNVYARRNAEIDFFSRWYGTNNFILTAFQYGKDNKVKRIGYIVNKLTFE